MTEQVYQRRGTLDAIVEVLIAYKWHLTIVGLALALGLGGSLWLGIIERLPEVPPWVWGMATYLLLSMLIAVVPVAVLVYRWYDPPGTYIVEIDPKDGDYRLLKIGPSLWEDLVVESPRETVGGVDDLSRITLNGRPGVEVLAIDVPDEDESRPPVATGNWLAGATAADVRSYRSTVEYVRTSLAARADRATQLRANLSTMVREASEEVVCEIIRTAEREGIAEGDRIEGVVEDVVEQYDDRDPVEDYAEDLDDQRDDLLDREESWDDRLSIEISPTGEGSNDGS